MKKLLLLLWASTALAAPLSPDAASRVNRTARFNPRRAVSLPNSVAVDTSWLRVFPAAGAGMPAMDPDLCTYLNGQGLLTGNYFCLRGDGTQVSAAATTLSAVATPAVLTNHITSSGTDGLDVSTMWLQGGSGSNPHYETAAVAAPTGDFTTCGFASPDTSAGTLVAKFGATTATQAWSMATGGATGSAPSATITTTDGTNTAQQVTAATPAGNARTHEWVLVCATYDWVSSGASVGTIYVNGTQVATDSTLRGPVAPSATTKWFVGANSDASVPYLGRFASAFLTETLLSQAQIQTLTARVLPVFTGSKGEASTTTRTTSRTCISSNGTPTTVGPGRPCIANGGVAIWQSLTNINPRSEAQANWTAQDLGGTTSAVNDSAFTTEGDKTADKVSFFAVSGTNYSMRHITMTGTAVAYTASCDLQMVSGTGQIYLYLQDSTGAAVASQACPLTTSWSRCVLSNVTLTAASYFQSIGIDGRQGHSAASAQDVNVGRCQTVPTAGDAPFVYTFASAQTWNGDNVSVATTIADASAGEVSLKYTPGLASSTNTQGIFTLMKPSPANSVKLQRLSTGVLRVYGQKNSGTLTALCDSSGLTWNAGQTYTLKTSWNRTAGTVAVTVDGVSVASCSSQTELPDAATALYIGSDTGSASYGNGTFKEICVGPAGACT